MQRAGRQKLFPGPPAHRALGCPRFQVTDNGSLNIVHHPKPGGKHSSQNYCGPTSQETCNKTSLARFSVPHFRSRAAQKGPFHGWADAPAVWVLLPQTSPPHLTQGSGTYTGDPLREIAGSLRTREWAEIHSDGCFSTHPSLQFSCI